MTEGLVELLCALGSRYVQSYSEDNYFIKVSHFHHMQAAALQTTGDVCLQFRVDANTLLS